MKTKIVCKNLIGLKHPYDPNLNEPLSCTDKKKTNSHTKKKHFYRGLMKDFYSMTAVSDSLLSTFLYKFFNGDLFNDGIQIFYLRKAD